MTKWKYFVPDTPSFCDHIWPYVELFGEIEHKMALASIIIPMDTRSLEKLKMAHTVKRAGDLHSNEMFSKCFVF